MARPPLVERITCVVSGAEVEGSSLVVRLTPRRGRPLELRDAISFAPSGELAVVHGIGRFLRVLRAGRVRAPSDPYRLHEDLEGAAALIERCRGAEVVVEAKRRFDRILTLWTESGVQRISQVLDFHEEADVLVVRRRGGQSLLRIPRASLIRYEAATRESLDVVAIHVQG